MNDAAVRTESEAESEAATGTDVATGSGADSVTVAVAAADAFDPETDFRNRYDQFKDAIVLPNDAFDRLFGPDRHTGYVDAAALNAPDAETDPLYALRFADEHVPRTVSLGSEEGGSGDEGESGDVGERGDEAKSRDGGATGDERETGDENGVVPVAYLRLNEQDAIGCDAATERSLVGVAAVDSDDYGPLTVRRDSTYRESTEERVCRISPALAAESGLEPGTTVEVVSARAHGRVHLELGVSETVPEDGIALSTHARKLLGVTLAYKADADDECAVTLRRPQREPPTVRTIERVAHRTLGRFVGYNEIQLRTIIGLNADENRDVVRADRETLDILGIEPGDRVVVESSTDRTTARCLPLDSDAYLVREDDDLAGDDINPTTILLPSTERDAVDVVVDDVVSVRRDMLYVTGKRVVPSMLGILGIFLTGLQALGLADFDLASPEVLAGIVASFAVVSVVIVWMVLWPERQKCSL